MGHTFDWDTRLCKHQVLGESIIAEEKLHLWPFLAAKLVLNSVMAFRYTAVGWKPCTANPICVFKRAIHYVRWYPYSLQYDAVKQHKVLCLWNITITTRVWTTVCYYYGDSQACLVFLARYRPNFTAKAHREMALMLMWLTSQEYQRVCNRCKASKRRNLSLTLTNLKRMVYG